MQIEGVSPITRLFLSEIKEVTIKPEVYTRRANIKRAYMEYLKLLGVSIKLSPSQFYEEVVAYFNALDVELRGEVRDVVKLDTHKGVDVIRGVMIPGFYAYSCEFTTQQMCGTERLLPVTKLNYL